jgi:ribose transport system ATP-binding protein
MTGPLGGVRLSRSAERAETRDWLSRLAVHPAEPELCVSKLSGGNQQRLILGRCLRLDPAVLVLDEPTEGVDVGAIEVIHDMLRTAAHRDGKAVIVCSSNTEELVALCDRVMVLGRGRPPRTLSGPDINRDAIDALALADTEANQCPA